MEVLANKIILNDLEVCTGFSFLQTPKSIDLVSQFHWFRNFIPEPTQYALQRALSNLRKVYNEHLVYIPGVHKNPTDVYTNLYDNWKEVKEQIVDKLVCEPEDCPLTYQVYWVLSKMFDNLPRKLIERAAEHKFDKEFALTRIFGIDDNAEGEK